MTTKIICFMLLVPVLAYPDSEFLKVMSWNSSEIEFTIPKNYPKNFAIFSFQVLQLPDYPVDSDVAQVVCNRPKRYSESRRPNSRVKRDIKQSKKERRRGIRKGGRMGFIDSMVNKPIPRNIRSQDQIAANMRKDWDNIPENERSQANMYRSRSRFRLLKNPGNLFKLLYDSKNALLSLLLQRRLNEDDFVHNDEHYVDVAIGMKDECFQGKPKTVKLYHVKLLITEPFQCQYPTEKMCMLPTGDLNLRQWENRDSSPLLVLPSFSHSCPNLTRRITIKMADLHAGFNPELVFSEEENAFYNNMALDRELRDSALSFSLSCIIKDPQNQTVAHLTSSGVLFVEDENDSPPVASRDRYVTWEYINFSHGSRTHKSRTNEANPFELSDKLFVVDSDLMENNDFSLSIEGFDFKDDTVQRSLQQFSVSKENCYNETSTLAKPLTAHCTIISPNLIFNENISQMNQSSINFALVFRDNSLLKGKGTSEVSYNVTILLNGTSESSIKTYDEIIHHDEIETNITVSRPAQKYARLGKIGLPLTFDASLFSLGPGFELSPDSANLGLNITRSEGILYISNPSRLEDALNQQWLLEITIKIKAKMVKKVFLSWSDETCPRKNSETCAKHPYMDDCIASCGIGSSGKCQWRPPKGRFITKHYATCSPGIATCPNGICDELENLEDLICPQDCYDANKKTSNIAKTDGHLQPRGIRNGFGVCTCDGDESCACFPVTVNKSIHQLSKNPRRKTITDGYATANQCDTNCKIGIACSIPICCFVVGIVIWRRRRYCGGKYKGDPDRSNNRADYNDDYSSGTVHGDAHYMALHSVRNNSPRQNNNQDLLSDLPLANYSIDRKWEFPRSQLIVEKTLGEGEFGKVMKAKAYEINSTAGCSEVAVKMLKSNSTEAELTDLLSEFELLKEVSHPNVIQLLGACTTKGGPVYLIMEFCKYGSLRTYLRRSRHFELESRVGAALIEEPGVDYKVTPKELLSFVWQICKGMTYLTTQKLVHRDLAARNILLAEDKVCKISDFGLTRDIYEGDLYRKRSKGRVPVKWMAPESLADHLYTNKSDVWSFGVLLWELVTLGSSPYPGVTPERLYTLLMSGYRMEKPENCSTELYQIMKKCWMEEQERRPTFDELKKTFEYMIDSEVEYLELRSLIATNRMYFDDDKIKPTWNEDDSLQKTGYSIEDLKSCEKDDHAPVDKDSYLLTKPVGPATFPPTPLNPRIHAHNPSYSPGECNQHHTRLPHPLQYSMLLDVPDEEEDAKTGSDQRQGSNLSEWDSDSGRATGDSGYITEDNKKALSFRSGSVPCNFTESLKPIRKPNGVPPSMYLYESEQTKRNPLGTEELMINGSLSGIITPSPSSSAGSNRTSSNSSIRDGIITPDSLTNTPKAIKRNPIIV